jgi:carbonic anhydrase
MPNLRKSTHLLLTLLFLVALATPAAVAGAGPEFSPDEALKMLQDGHARYLEGKPHYPHQGRERRALTAGQGQHPFAAVLSCADSRVPVELIFDQGIGDLFVVRVAGSVAGADAIGSLEYAVDHLATPLVVLLGHTQCGAVAAVLENAKLPPNVAALLAPIKPAVDQAKADNPGGDKEVLLNAAIKDNVWQAMEDLLQNSPLIRERVKNGKVKVLGALYEIDTGQVQWLGPHPDQEKLLGIKAKAPAAKPGKKAKKSRREED